MPGGTACSAFSGGLFEGQSLALRPAGSSRSPTARSQLCSCVVFHVLVSEVVSVPTLASRTVLTGNSRNPPLRMALTIRLQPGSVRNPEPIRGPSGEGGFENPSSHRIRAPSGSGRASRGAVTGLSPSDLFPGRKTCSGFSCYSFLMTPTSGASEFRSWVGSHHSRGCLLLSPWCLKVRLSPSAGSRASSVPRNRTSRKKPDPPERKPSFQRVGLCPSFQA